MLTYVFRYDPPSRVHEASSGKWCPGCSQYLPRESFAKNRAKSDGLQTHCRTCRKPLDRRTYRRRSAIMIAQTRAARTRRQDDVRRKLWEYLRTHPCAVCGATDPLVLEFHHVNGAEKEYEVGQMIAAGLSWERILTELTKCIVLCANDHRRVTMYEAGYWKSRFADGDPT